MSDWRTTTLGELVEGVRGVSYRPDQLRRHVDPDSAILLRATNIRDGRLWLDDIQIVPRSIVRESQILRSGDIVVCMSNGSKSLVGKSAAARSLPGTAFTIGAFCAAFRPREGCHSAFVRRLFESTDYRKNVDLVLAGSAINNLRIGQVESFSCRVPPPEERSTIAQLLDLIDSAMERTQAMVSKLRRVSVGLLRDLVTCGVDDNGHIRDPTGHPEQFKASPLGIIPKGWDVPTLASLCTHIGSGATPRGGEEVYVHSGVLFIRSQNVTFEGLNLDDVAHIPHDIHLGMMRSKVRAHDVLFNITGASIGRCCAMPHGLGEANVNQHVCILRVPDARDCDARLLSAVLGSPIGQRQLEALNTCGNRQGLNYQQLGAFVLPWPTAEERKAIAAILAASASAIQKEEANLSKLTAVKSGLMHDLLSGRVRMRQVEGVGA